MTLLCELESGDIAVEDPLTKWLRLMTGRACLALPTPRRSDSDSPGLVMSLPCAASHSGRKPNRRGPNDRKEVVCELHARRDADLALQQVDQLSATRDISSQLGRRAKSETAPPRP